MTDVPPALILNLRRMIRDCHDCDLRANASAPVPWSGPLNPDIAVLGMAPGRTEDRLQEPFVGDAGVRLRTLLKGAGINPDECAYVNATNCLPPNDKVYDNHLAACRKWMRHQIAIINPRYLLVCGEVALKAVRETETWPKLTSLHGKPMWWPNPPAPAKPTLWTLYHPAAALRQGRYHQAIVDDLAAFNEFRRTGQWIEECYVCGAELAGWDDKGWGIGLCERHCTRAGVLFDEEEVGTRV